MKKKLIGNFSPSAVFNIVGLSMLLGSVTCPIFAIAADSAIQQLVPNMSDTKRIKTMASTDGVSMQKIYESVSKPTSPQQLLVNIQFALNHNLLMRTDFYSVENLEKFFGGKAQVQAIPSKNGDIDIQSAVSHLGDVFLNAKELHGISIDFYLQKKNISIGKFSARILIPGASADPRLTVDLVKNVFGDNAEIKISNSPDVLSDETVADRMRTADPKGPAPFVGYGAPATQKFGNKRIEFLFAGPATKASLVLITLPAGQIKNIAINQSEE